MFDIVFREGTISDSSTLAKIISTTRAWTCFGIDYEKAVGLFAKMEDKIFIAEVDDRIAGFITLRPNGMGNLGSYIRMVAVAEEYRGQGIGAKMIEFISEISSDYMPNIFLICSVENTEAQRFYLRMGFEKIGIMKDLVIQGQDEILFRKSFGPFIKNEADYNVDESVTCWGDNHCHCFPTLQGKRY